MSDNAIELEGITKRYKEKTAVNNLSFCVKKGQVFSLLGVNGAGKTTLIKMLSGILEPSGGDAKIFGKSIKTDMQEIKKYISVSPQENAVAQNLSVRENIELMTGVYGMEKEHGKQKAQEVMEKTGIADIERQKAKTLSGGQKRRLSIAMALVSEPSLLFLDEPTLGLDILARRELWKIVEELKGNTTVILTTHYLEEAEALSDMIAVLSKGSLCAVGTAKEIIEASGEKNFEDAFVKFAGEGAEK